MPSLLPIALLVLGGLAALSPLLVRRLGPRAAYVSSAVFGVLAVAFTVAGSDTLSGDAPRFTYDWLPALGVRISLVLDGLALLFSLLILVVGALVLAYSASYFSDASPSVSSIYTWLTLFAASMLGLVLAGDAILLFVFWEMTTISSFFLIGGRGGDNRAPATRALLVTGIGSLALLLSLVLMASIAGDFTIQSILANRDGIAESSIAPLIFAGLLLGAFTKSAQVPFHFWLPGAMVAPTPISTYLHAATMVKAGIYLVARFTPLLAGTEWRNVVIVFGVATAFYGAAIALKQHDLKSLLAYSTVSQLGFLMALVGVGTFASLAAASVHILAHGAYKATLFMIVGVIEKEAGSRDIREVSGLRQAMPRTALVAGAAALSMAGVPILLGFVSKEEAYIALTEAPGDLSWVVATTALMVGASILTFAYSARFYFGAFEGSATRKLDEPAGSLVAPAAASSIAGVVLGLAVFALDRLVSEAAASATGSGQEIHLALWHGFTPALALSVLTIAAGSALVYARERIGTWMDRLRSTVRGDETWDRLYDSTISLGRITGEPFLSDAPRRHLSWIAIALLALTTSAFFVTGFEVEGSPAESTAGDWAVLALLVASTLGVASATNRMAAVALLGATGFLVAITFALLGAPDLVLTQLLVETLTVVLVVLVFRRLPRTFHPTSRRRHRAGLALGGSLGLSAIAVTWLLTSRRNLSEVGSYYLGNSIDETGGTNVVNTILVDFRALDTLGEITVLAVAAIGIFVLVGTKRGRST